MEEIISLTTSRLADDDDWRRGEWVGGYASLDLIHGHMLTSSLVSLLISGSQWVRERKRERDEIGNRREVYKVNTEGRKDSIKEE